MTKLLLRLFIHEDQPDVRSQYGSLAGIVGILLNLLLFVGKLLCGILSGSIAITADAMNNLSDAGSSIVTLIGFKMAGKKPDPEHPFGHGRIEYISGLIVAFVILMMGYELLTGSIDKILHPEAVSISLLPAIIMLAAVIVKWWMSVFNGTLAGIIDSAAMRATAADSRSDAISTAAVLIGSLIGHFFSLPLDGWLGLIVSVLILKTGIDAAKDTISPLLGQPPEKEFVDAIESIVMAHEDVVGIHDLIVHDYGPGRVIVSLHAEVPGEGDLFAMHDLIDNIERELAEKLSCVVSIHMDPIDTHNPIIGELKLQAKAAAESLDKRCTVHDVRVVTGPSHTNLIFDIVPPHDLCLSDREIREKVTAAIPRLHEKPTMYAVINIDRDYTGHCQ